MTADYHNLLDYVPAEDSFSGKVILVTGAGTGIGRAISIAYARFGATVILLGKNTKELESVYDEIEALAYPQAAIYPLHMEGATPDDYYEMADTFEKQLGGLDGIVLNAAWLPAYIPFKEYDEELWLKTISVNLHANFLITKACLSLLEQATDPAIVFSSHDARKAYSGAFGIAKAGSQAMMDIIADEYDNNDSFIRVNSIDSGPLRTQMRKMNFPGEDVNTLARPEAIIGPYLYFMGADAGKRTNEKVAYEQLNAELTWAGES